MPFYEGSIADGPLVERIFAEQGIGAIMHFAGSIVVPELVENPLKYYRNNTVATHALISAAVRRGREAHHLLVDRRGLRRAGEGADRRGRSEGADQSLRRVQADDRADARAMRRRRIRSTMARSATSTSPGPIRRAARGQIGKGSTHLIKVAVRGRGRQARRTSRCTAPTIATPDGTCIRDYIHVSDLAAAHVAALEWLIAHPDENLLMNCGYGRGLSVLEVLDAVDRLTNGSRSSG